MKKVILSFIVVSLLSVFPSAGFARETSTEGLEVWYHAGYQEEDVNFKESHPGYWQSILEFSSDGLYYAGFGARYQFVNSAWKQFIMGFDFHTARSLDGIVKDTDYLVSNTSQWYFSESDVEADNNRYDIFAGWQLLNANDGKIKVDGLLGYYYTSYDYDIWNVTTTTADYVPLNVVTIGHASSYEARLKGTYIGVDGAVHLLDDKLRLDAAIKYIPRVRGDASGKWELRDLRFEQTGHGEGFIYSAGILFVPKENWAFGLNLESSSLEFDGNTDNFVLSTYEWISQNDLDYTEVKSFRSELRIAYVF